MPARAGKEHHTSQQNHNEQSKHGETKPVVGLVAVLSLSARYVGILWAVVVEFGGGGSHCEPTRKRRNMEEYNETGETVAAYYTRNVYGELKYYPANVAAEALAKIAGTKTLRVKDMTTAARAFGFHWVNMPDPEAAPIPL